MTVKQAFIHLSNIVKDRERRRRRKTEGGKGEVIGAP
jgi:hypothetical protein